MSSYYKDPDPQETEDWIESLEAVIEHEGKEKADYLLRTLTDRARSCGVSTSPGIFFTIDSCLILLVRVKYIVLYNCLAS